MQTCRQGLLLRGNQLDLPLCPRHQAAVDGKGGRHGYSPSGHHKNHGPCEYLPGGDAGLTRAQTRRERLHRISNNVPAVILTPVVFHAACGSH